jgi:hypothetical protein
MSHRFRGLIAAVAALTVALALPAGAHAATATQTWVSGVGDDANASATPPCPRTAPCKTFAGAISATTTGGVISVLDPGGYGAVTITKAVTIDGNGVFAGVVVIGTNAIVVNAPAGSNVVLRGLTLQYVSANCTAPSALHGIRFLSGGALHVENVNINGFPGAAIDAEPTIDGTSLTVTNSELRDNCSQGLLARRSGGHLDATLSGGFRLGRSHHPEHDRRQHARPRDRDGRDARELRRQPHRRQCRRRHADRRAERPAAGPIPRATAGPASDAGSSALPRSDP